MTFSLPLYFSFANKRLHVHTGGFFYLSAVALGIWASVYGLRSAWALRDAWSVEPAARDLITSGPYRFSRHPLYTSYVLRNFSAIVLYRDIGLVLFVVLWTGMLIYRIRCEERILSECYPDYEQYRDRVWMFSPKLF